LLHGAGVLGATANVLVTVDSTAICTGKLVYLKVDGGPNTSMTPLSASLDGQNQATLGYLSTTAGTDNIRVWMDIRADGLAGHGDPEIKGSINWPQPTATPTSGPGPNRPQGGNAPRATATPKPSSPTKTPTPTKP
jgi:hypothetical protein